MGFSEMLPVLDDGDKKKAEGEKNIKNADDIISRFPTVEGERLKVRHIRKHLDTFKSLAEEIESLRDEEKTKARSELEKNVWDIANLVRGDYKLWKEFDKELMGLLSADFVINKIPKIDREVTNIRLLEKLEDGYKRSEDDIKYLSGEDRIRFRDEFVDRISNTHGLIKHDVNPWNEVKREMRRMRTRVSMIK